MEKLSSDFEKEVVEDDEYYLTAMEEGENTELLNDQERLDFIFSLKIIT